MRRTHDYPKTTRCRLCNRVMLQDDKIKNGACVECRIAGVTVPLLTMPKPKPLVVPVVEPSIVEWKPFVGFAVFKKAAILEALRRTNGNRTQAAKMCVMSIRALRNWIRGMKNGL